MTKICDINKRGILLDDVSPKDSLFRPFRAGNIVNVKSKHLDSFGIEQYQIEDTENPKVWSQFDCIKNGNERLKIIGDD
jgi:hypothetical protein